MATTDDDIRGTVRRLKETIARIDAERAARPRHVDPACAWCGEPVLTWQSGEVRLSRDSDGRVFSSWGYHQKCLKREVKGNR